MVVGIDAVSGNPYDGASLKPAIKQVEELTGVKYQQEREQTVIDTGVYSIVRHPMYAGVIPWLIGMALWLESYAAALLVVIPALLLAVRILIEGEFLKRELKGYDAYMREVRYRLIPFLW